MKTNQIYIASMATLISGSLFAGTMGPIAPPVWSPVITLSIGPAWYNNNHSQTIEDDEAIFRTYTAGNSNNAVFSGELFIGLHNALTDTITGEIGVALAANSNMNFSGDIWDNADPLFDNFSYGYNVQHSRIGLKGKLSRDFGYMVEPYVSASIDVGFNRARNFELRPLIPEAVPFPGFQSQSTTTLAYTLGIGLQKAFATHWIAGIGYEFASLGSSELALAPGRVVGGRLCNNNLYTNELQFSLSYVA